MRWLACAVGVLSLLLASSAMATVQVGLDDFGAGSAALDHLITSHGFDAAYTRYDPASLANLADFSVNDSWFVPSYGFYSSYDGLRSNRTFRAGPPFSRVVVTGLIADVQHPAGDGSSQFLLN